MPSKLKTSRQAVVDAINHTNNLWDDPLTLERIALGYAQEIVDAQAPRNTRLLVYALNGSGLKGTQSITYDRYKFHQFFLNITVMVFGPLVQKASDVLPLVNEKYQTDLRKEDIIDVDVSGMGADWTVDIVARPGNVMWTGKFRLRYADHLATLDELIVNNVVDVIVPPYVLGPKPRGEYLAYGYDFTEMASTLDGLWVDSTLQQSVIEELNVVSNLNFTLEDPPPPGMVGLYQSEVKGRYTVGPNDKYNPLYKKVLVLRLSAQKCNYAGEIFLHYHPVE